MTNAAPAQTTREDLQAALDAYLAALVARDPAVAPWADEVFNTENKRLRIGRTNFGDVASYYITDSYRDWIIDPCQVHCWVADLLGLGQYLIRWRTLEQGRPRQEDG